MRNLRNTHSPARAQVVITLDGFQIVIENLIAIVCAIRDPDVAFTVNLESVRQIELSGLATGLLAAGLCEKSSVLVVLHNTIVAVAVGYKDVALRIPADICWPAQNVF